MTRINHLHAINNVNATSMDDVVERAVALANPA